MATKGPGRLARERQPVEPLITFAKKLTLN